MSTYRKNKLKFEYSESGQGQPLLFLHGAGVTSRAYSENIKLLSQEYHVFAPNYLKTAGLPLTWGLDDCLDLLIDFIDSRKLTGLTIVGHSFGGLVALNLAARCQKVDRLVLVDSIAIPPQYSVLELLYRFFLQKTWEDLTNLRLAKILPKIVRAFLDNLDQSPATLLKSSLMILRSVYRGFDEFSKITVPTLIIWADRDHILAMSDGQTIQQKIAKSKLEIVEGNHDWCIGYPEKLRELIRL